MTMAETLAFAARNATRNRGRSALVAALVAFIVAVVVTAASMFAATERGLERGFPAAASGELVLRARADELYGIFGSEIPLVGEYATVPPVPARAAVESALREVAGVRAWTRQVTCPAEIDIDGRKAKAVTFGVLPEEYFGALDGLSRPGDEGRPPFDTSRPSLMLNGALARTMEARLGRPLALGDRVTLAFASERGVALRTVEYAGSWEYPAGNPMLDRVALVDPATARYLAGYPEGGAEATSGETSGTADAAASGSDSDAGGDVVVEESGGLDFGMLEEALGGGEAASFEGDPADGPWSFYLVRLDGTRGADEVARELSARLGGEGVETLGWRDAAGMQTLMPFAVQAVFWAGLAFVIAGSCFVVSNTLAMTVFERTREIGTMRAVGASKGFVFLAVCAETVVVAFVGTLVGVALSLAACEAVAALAIPLGNGTLSTVFGGGVLRVAPSAAIYAVVAAAAMLAALAMSLYPAAVAVSVEPVAALAEV